MESIVIATLKDLKRREADLFEISLSPSTKSTFLFHRHLAEMKKEISTSCRKSLLIRHTVTGKKKNKPKQKNLPDLQSSIWREVKIEGEFFLVRRMEGKIQTF